MFAIVSLRNHYGNALLKLLNLKVESQSIFNRRIIPNKNLPKFSTPYNVLGLNHVKFIKYFNNFRGIDINDFEPNSRTTCKGQH